jgi:hypothetical protein
MTMIRSTALYGRLIGVLTLAVALISGFVGSASARATYETETFLSNKGDWDIACARVEATNNQPPPGNVRFKLKDRTSGESDSAKVKLTPKTNYSQACLDLGDTLEDGHRYRLRAIYPGYENANTYEPSSDKRSFTYQE